MSNGGAATVSRAVQESFHRPGIAAGFAGLVAVLALAGCSAGQDTQTDSVEPAVNGMLGQVGPIAIRDAEFAYPQGGVYPSGGSAPLVLTIVNTGPTDEALIEVSSPAAASVDVRGARDLPARQTIQVGTPDKVASPTSSVVITTTPAPSSSAPPSVPPSGASGSAPVSVSVPSSSAAPVPIGKATIVLNGLTDPLYAGKTYPVTFVFRNAGSVTLNLPIATPITARPEPTSG
jgi:copper(I)-binding protein